MRDARKGGCCHARFVEFPLAILAAQLLATSRAGKITLYPQHTPATLLAYTTPSSFLAVVRW